VKQRKANERHAQLNNPPQEESKVPNSSGDLIDYSGMTQKERKLAKDIAVQ
jgi:hypothetical protein